jgi:hypothetical protein
LQSSVPVVVELLLSSDGLRDGEGVVDVVVVVVVRGLVRSALLRRRFEGETGGRRTLGGSPLSSLSAADS